MDVVQAYLLGPDYHQTYTTYSPYLRHFLRLLSTTKSHLLPLLEQKPDLATIALLLVIVFVSLKILNMLVSTLFFWFRLARRIAFWGGLCLLGTWMYVRGPEGVAEDVRYWRDVWGQDYEYWTERERVARLVQQGGGGRGGWGGRG